MSMRTQSLKNQDGILDLNPYIILSSKVEDRAADPMVIVAFGHEQGCAVTTSIAVARSN